MLLNLSKYVIEPVEMELVFRFNSCAKIVIFIKEKKKHIFYNKKAPKNFGAPLVRLI